VTQITPDSTLVFNDAFAPAFSEALDAAGYASLQTSGMEDRVLWDVLSCVMCLPSAVDAGSSYDEDAGVYVANPTALPLLDRCLRIVAGDVARSLTEDIQRSARVMEVSALPGRQTLSLDKALAGLARRPAVIDFRAGDGSHWLLRPDFARRLWSMSMLVLSVGVEDYALDVGARALVSDRIEDNMSVATVVPSNAEAREIVKAERAGEAAAYRSAMSSLATKLSDLR
jgi:hypothetical protein